MDLNEAAIKIKELEVIQSQINHLQSEARKTIDVDYATDCNDNAQELLLEFFQKNVD